jgi:hypothetical protein
MAGTTGLRLEDEWEGPYSLTELPDESADYFDEHLRLLIPFDTQRSPR